MIYSLIFVIHWIQFDYAIKKWDFWRPGFFKLSIGWLLASRVRDMIWINSKSSILCTRIINVTFCYRHVLVWFFKCSWKFVRALEQQWISCMQVFTLICSHKKCLRWVYILVAFKSFLLLTIYWVILCLLKIDLI